MKNAHAGRQRGAHTQVHKYTVSSAVSLHIIRIIRLSVCNLSSSHCTFRKKANQEIGTGIRMNYGGFIGDREMLLVKSTVLPLVVGNKSK